MDFWTFVDRNPWLSFGALFLICCVIEQAIVRYYWSRRG